MTEENRKTLAIFEEKLGKKISWYAEAPFYMSSLDKIIRKNVLFYLTEVTFHVYAEDFQEDFESLDIYYTYNVSKDDVKKFADGEIKTVKRLNPLFSIRKDTLLCLEFDKNIFRYVEIKGTEFKQLLSIAQAKQKYSRTVSQNNQD